MDEPIVDEVVEPVEPAVGEPAVEEWTGPSREDWEQTQQYLQSIGQALPTLYQELQGLRPEPAAQAAPPAPEYDPFDAESVSAFINHAVTNGVKTIIEEQLGPFQGLLGMVASERGEALARTELEQLQENLGSFDPDTAYLVAAGIIERGGDPSRALQVAAKHAFDLEQRIRADERAKYKSELENLGQAPPEVVGGASPAELETVPTGPNRYEVAVQRALARRRPVSPTG